MTYAVRKHLLELLDGESAHISLEQVLVDFPIENINRRIEGSHTAWQLLEHIRSCAVGHSRLLRKRGLQGDDFS
jgi:hypothetical protein